MPSSCFDNYDALANKNLIIFFPGSHCIQEDPATRGRLTQLLVNVSNGGTAQRVPSLQDGPLSGVDRKLS